MTRPPGAVTGEQTRRGRHRHSATRPTGRRRPWRTFVRLVACLCVLSGAGLILSVQAYKSTVQADARRLVRTVTSQIHTANAAAPCTAPKPSESASPGTARAILQIPRIGLTAPILAGTDTTTLDSGIGHLDSSTWPDQGGKAVLEAHNVTFFTRLPELRAGDVITVAARCRSWSYAVVSHAVLDEGTPLHSGAAPTLVLVTCWPTDALYFTHQRYLVTASLTRASDIAAIPTAPQASPPLSAAIPPQLRAADLGPDSIGVTLGVLHASARTGPLPANSAALQSANQAVRLLATAHRAAAEHNNQWWHTIAPALPPGVATIFANLRWRSHLNATVNMNEGAPTRVSLRAVIETRSGPQQLTVSAVAAGRILHISKVALRQLTPEHRQG